MERITRISLDYPKTTLAILSAVTLMLAAGLPRVRSEFGYRVLIGDDHPAVQRLDRFIEKFGGGFPIQIAWECGPGFACGNAFDAESMKISSEISDKLLSMPGVQSVTAPSNAPLLVAHENGFVVRRFVEKGRRPSDTAKLAALAVSDPLWSGTIVSTDGMVAAISVQPVDSRDETSAAVSLAVLEVIGPYEERGLSFYLVGDPIANLIVGRDLAESTARLIPFTVLVIGAILLLFCRSLSFAAVALVTMGVALAWTFGMLGWLGWPQDGILEVLAPLILVVGVCDSVHLLARFSSSGRDASERTRSERLAAAARSVGPPALVTSLTTAAAFVSFVASDLATFVRFGSIASFGVLCCLILTFALLPILVTLVPANAARQDSVLASWQIILEGLLGVSERRDALLLATAALGLAVCLIGVKYLRVDQDWTESLGESSSVVRSRRFVDERLGQSNTLELELRIPSGFELEDPATLSRLDDFQLFLETVDGLGEATSILDIIGRVNRLLNDDRPEFDRASDTHIGNAEILELIGFDDPGLLNAWVSFDRSVVRVSVGALELTTSAQRIILDDVERYTTAKLPPNWEVVATGRLAMQFAWVRDVQSTQMRSFPIALVLVFGMVAIFFKSIRLAALAMVPTLMPIVVTLGAMGWAGLTLDVGRSMIAVILLGIGVDDSVHLLDHYKRQCRAGADPANAIRASIRQTGRAVITTSFALALGFLTLMASAWQSISSFGIFIAIAILGALLASVLVLPALIFALARWRSRQITGNGRSGRKPKKFSRVVERRRVNSPEPDDSGHFVTQLDG